MAGRLKVAWVDGDVVTSSRQYEVLLLLSKKPAACEKGAVARWDYRAALGQGVEWPRRCYRRFDEVPDSARLTLKYPVGIIRGQLKEQDDPVRTSVMYSAAISLCIFGVVAGVSGVGLALDGVSAAVQKFRRPQPPQTQAV
ncbi:unnamed protein product [Vitrella brassicaformis CCMP3155]|uniref:Uncharacterized protein n=1 Tax=Vitrella brassicaformis (strain CCMP3155) TaxID=1169540 RepID=A0A0G4GF94_VITBC|nr:unnamed protein product [Vitrella brassicaformis CCMP3155]|eukprot:CEM27822.1 unnamed protein product [Vitrella brassicaformis CCMP3155]